MKQWIQTVLQKALNRYLALDPESKSRIVLLQGKIITIELLGLKITLHLIFIGDTIEIQLNTHPHPDAHIKGTPLRLVHLALSQDRHSFFADDVTIEGDAAIAEQVILLFDQLEIDWEDYLSHWIGDVPAYHLGRIGKKLKNWRRESCDTLTQNLNEYLHEEIHWFPPREAVQDFFSDVDQLRIDVDRLEAKMNQRGHE